MKMDTTDNDKERVSAIIALARRLRADADAAAVRLGGLRQTDGMSSPRLYKAQVEWGAKNTAANEATEIALAEAGKIGWCRLL